MFLRRQSEPGRKMAAGLESKWVDLDGKGQRDDRADPRNGGQQLAD
jgi:hypothetical protein